MERKTLFLVLYCVTRLVLPSACQNHKAWIHDYHNDLEMVDEACTGTNHTKYCHKQIGNCERGIHVMCMVYKTNMVMGAQCEGGAMLKMRQEIKNLIIALIEELRKEASDGLARGLNDALLPKAYNLKPRLLWNNDLALFAQVWTNQCRRELDKCRDTETLLDVEQFIGVDFFTVDEWENIRNKDEKLKVMKEKCLTLEKITDAIRHMIKLMKDKPKEVTTEDMINSFDGKRNTYLMLLYKNTTEIGCGLSYYLDYKWFEEKNQKRDVFVLQLVCNLSSRPVKGMPIYDTSPSIDDTSPSTDDTSPSVTENPNKDNRLTNSPYSGEDSPDAVPTDPLADGQGPGIVVLPIITVADAPLDLAQGDGPTKSSESQKSIAPSARKSSIFSRAPIFNLPSRNHDNTSNDNIEDKISLKKKLKMLLEQVPRKDIPRLRELLKQIVTKHKSEEKQMLRFDTVGSEAQEYVPDKSNNVPTNIVNDHADDELLQLTNGKFKETNRGLTRFISDVENYPDNTDIIQIQDHVIELDADTPFHIPNIRKLKPIVHVENKLKNFQHEKILDRYSAGQQLDNNEFVKSKTAIIDQIDDKTNMGSNIEGQPVSYTEEDNINNHKPISLDDMNSKRRIYLENEVSKLKRKLHNLRHFIDKNDVNENARIRPMVTSHIGQRTSKFDERRNFYMPDRAHPLPEF